MTQVNELVNAILSRNSFDYSMNIDFGNYCIALLSNNHELDGRLRKYFREFLSKKEPDCIIHAVEGEVHGLDLDYTVKQPEPGKTKIKEEYHDAADGRIVKKRLTGVHFLFTDTLNCAVGPCIENYNQVVNFVNNRYIEFMLNQGALLFHSSAVATGDRGLAMSGFSGAGKSTLALHVMSREANFISNDRLMVVQKPGELAMYGVAKYPRINPGTILNNRDLQTLISDEEKAELEEMPLEELWELEQKYDLYIDQVYGEDRFYLQARMDGLVILNWDRNSNDETVISSVNLSDREELFPAFMKSPGLFYNPAQSYEMDKDKYRELLSSIEVIEISGGINFDMAADYLLNWLQELKS